MEDKAHSYQVKVRRNPGGKEPRHHYQAACPCGWEGPRARPNLDWAETDWRNHMCNPGDKTRGG
jgi:hypothetical protein